MGLPLAGLRILAVEQYGAGPYASLFLAGLGAEVVKIENPKSGGDVSRATGPYRLGAADSLFFQTFNLNKRSLTLDLKGEDGRAVFTRLAATAAAVLNNLRGDQPARLGLDYAALSPANEAIVCGHLSAYGRDNERAAWPGYDYLMQAEAGFMCLTGEPDGPPARFGLSMVDFMTGMMLAAGVTAAMLDAQRTGRGGDVDVSLLDAAVHQLSYPATWYLNEGHVTNRAPRSAHPAITPSQLVRTADGWLFVMCQTDKFWQALLKTIDAPELGEDPRFSDMAARLANRGALTETLDARFSRADTAGWLARLRGHVPVAPVNDMAAALDNPFLAQVGMIAEMAHPVQGRLRALAHPLKIDGVRPPTRPAPPLGGDTAALLAELGYDDAAQADMRRRGVV